MSNTGTYLRKSAYFRDRTLCMGDLLSNEYAYPRQRFRKP